MPIELAGVIEPAPEIVVKLVGTGPPGESPHIGENGNWFIGDLDTGVPASGGGAATEHGALSGRDKEDQHPIEAVTGLKGAIDSIPPAIEPITNIEMDEMLK